MPGFSLENVYLSDHDDDVKACLGYWDYDKVMRMTVQRMNWRLRITALTARLLGAVTEMPKIPNPSEALRQYYLVPAAAKDPESLAELIKQVNNIALEDRVNFISLPLDPQNPMLESFSRFRHVRVKMHFLAKPLTTKAELSAMSQRKLYIDVLDI
jgi:hypothetical protein